MVIIGAIVAVVGSAGVRTELVTVGSVDVRTELMASAVDVANVDEIFRNVSVAAVAVVT